MTSVYFAVLAQTTRGIWCSIGFQHCFSSADQWSVGAYNSDLRRYVAMDFGRSWDSHLPLVEFAYNNSYHSSIEMAPYETLYGMKCRSPLCWAEAGEREPLGPDLILETTEKVRLIQQGIQTTHSH